VEPDGGLTGPLLPARFESVRLLGHGGMGVVFLAQDRLLTRQVAIKILAQEFAADAVTRERFARETALAGRLGAHPNIVTAYEAGEWRQRPYVVFEYMPNGSLADRLQANGTPPRNEALRWLVQAAAAVDHAHAAKVIHRDIKPANLLLDQEGNLRVADFGVSRSDGEATLTADGDVVGTVGYLAPEQVDGRGATAASDRFALGVVAYQLLTGRLPTADGPELAPAAEAVFDRALADEPDRRYPTATAFVDALQASLAAEPSPTLPLPTRRKLLPQRTTPGARPVPASPPAPARHRQRGAALASRSPAPRRPCRRRPGDRRRSGAGPETGRNAAGPGTDSCARDQVRGLAVQRRCEPRRLRSRRPRILPLASRDTLGARRRLGLSRQHTAACAR
jgi:serine/threonine-protein kinase